MRNFFAGLRGKPVVVAGGANYDLKGRSFLAVQPGTSNPGKLLACPGGVGRNIAEALARLGVPVTLLSALGEDFSGREILSLCQEAGVDITRVLQVAGGRTGTFLAVTAPDGELELALADMEILVEFNSEYIAANGDLLAGAGLIVADANLPSEALAALAQYAHPQGPGLVLEAVSMEKAIKLGPLLERASVLAANRREMAALSGLDLSGPEGWCQAGTWFAQRGGQLLLLKLGEAGLYVDGFGHSGHFLPETGQGKDTTGAGDSLLAGFLAAALAGGDFDEASRAALAVAAATFNSEYSVARDLSPGLIGGFICR